MLLARSLENGRENHDVAVLVILYNILLTLTLLARLGVSLDAAKGLRAVSVEWSFAVGLAAGLWALSPRDWNSTNCLVIPTVQSALKTPFESLVALSCQLSGERIDAGDVSSHVDGACHCLPLLYCLLTRGHCQDA